MKTVKISFLVLSCILFFVACSTAQMSIQIPVKETIVVDYPNYDVFMAELQNKSLSEIEVKVVSKGEEKWVRSFGLNAMGTAKVKVEKENQLVLYNNGRKEVKLNINIEETTRSPKVNKSRYISFTLQNTGAKSIPLIIPTVMNPNLSPYSKSGVDLKIGQEILFKNGLKKYVLLTVDDNIKNGDVLDINQLLADRKRELGL